MVYFYHLSQAEILMEIRAFKSFKNIHCIVRVIQSTTGIHQCCSRASCRFEDV